ncbi:hypothetical protein DV515_00013449 [Chloebia gouldiae]|uniref:Uncharacterized protein n=1 Tax=Chloebia gouldiae TaxID=44316 RepID=A0A3L8S1C8_CHLGU|nr:hypothetical protein DV515_00013449 [Chloebia gouldiae]
MHRNFRKWIFYVFLCFGVIYVKLGNHLDGIFKVILIIIVIIFTFLLIIIIHHQ